MYYTFVMFDDNNRCLDVIKMQNPVVEGNNVTYKDGLLQGISQNFIIIDSDVNIDIDSDVSEWISRDIKSELLPPIKKQEKRSDSIQAMVTNLMLDPSKIEMQKQLKEMQKMITQIMFMK